VSFTHTIPVPPINPPCLTPFHPIPSPHSLIDQAHPLDPVVAAAALACVRALAEPSSANKTRLHGAGLPVRPYLSPYLAPI